MELAKGVTSAGGEFICSFPVLFYKIIHICYKFISRGNSSLTSQKEGKNEE
jgi:hypothetical protein